MSEFTAFVERPEKVEAFQFTGPHQAERVLDAFGVPYDNWTLHRQGKTYRLEFQLKRGQGTVTLSPMSTSLDAIVYNGQITVGHDSKYAVVTGSWIVKRYIDTDHPEVTVLSDKEFRRKYQASIEAA